MSRDRYRPCHFGIDLPSEQQEHVATVVLDGFELHSSMIRTHDGICQSSFIVRFSGLLERIGPRALIAAPLAFSLRGFGPESLKHDVPGLTKGPEKSSSYRLASSWMLIGSSVKQIKESQGGLAHLLFWYARWRRRDYVEQIKRTSCNYRWPVAHRDYKPISPYLQKYEPFPALETG